MNGLWDSWLRCEKRPHVRRTSDFDSQKTPCWTDYGTRGCAPKKGSAMIGLRDSWLSCEKRPHVERLAVLVLELQKKGPMVNGLRDSWSSIGKDSTLNGLRDSRSSFYVERTRKRLHGKGIRVERLAGFVVEQRVCVETRGEGLSKISSRPICWGLSF